METRYLVVRGARGVIMALRLKKSILATYNKYKYKYKCKYKYKYKYKYWYKYKCRFTCQVWWQAGKIRRPAPELKLQHFNSNFATQDLNFLRENLDTSTHTNASVRFKIENLNTGTNTNKGGFFDSSTP